MKLTAISGGRPFAIALAAAAGLTGCADSPAGPGDQAGEELAPGLLISEPVRSGSEPVRSGAALAGGTEDLAYISARLGTFPDAISAAIRWPGAQ